MERCSSLVMSRICIFGSTGFIGDYLSKNLCETSSISIREEGWRQRLGKEEVYLNLIGKAHDHQSKATEEEYYYANVELARQVYNAFIQSEAKLLIHISSLAALEEFEASRPLVESDSCNPVSWYGKSKREAEQWLLEQTVPQGKKLVILRPPMIHGPGDKGNLGLLYKLISKGIPYPLAAFENNRSFISIDNFCFFIEQIIGKQEQLSSGIYHVADDEPVSTQNIIEIIKVVTNTHTLNFALPRCIVNVIARIGDVVPIPLNSKRLKKMTGNLLVSNVKIKAALGIEKLPLTAKDGLEKTIESFKEDKK